MSTLNPASVDLSDERIADIADFTGMQPTEVLDEATRYAAEQGLTVDEELDVVEENISETVLEEALGLNDEDDNDL